MMVLKIISVYLYAGYRQLSQRTVSELGRTITVKFSAGGKVTKEMVLNDSVMNLPSDCCQLAGVLAKPVSMMDRTSTDEAFALLQLANAWWWIEMTPNTMDYIIFYKHSWAVSNLLVGLNNFPLNRCSKQTFILMNADFLPRDSYLPNMEILCLLWCCLVCVLGFVLFGFFY